MDRFEVGEVAIFVRPGSVYYGSEVTVMSELQLRDVWNLSTKRNEPQECYIVDSPEANPPPMRPGHVAGFWVAKPEWLKKKGPPVELGSWKALDGIWSPTRENA